MPATSPSAAPFAAFNFSVEIRDPASGRELCEAAFAECDGLEVTMDVKTIRQGGANGSVVRLAGPLAYGQITLKRGLTDAFDLWDWVEAVAANPALRYDGEVVLLSPDRATTRARWVLHRCLPVKLKAPPLNARDGIVAIEELGVAYDYLTLRRGGGGGR